MLKLTLEAENLADLKAQIAELVQTIDVVETVYPSQPVSKPEKQKRKKVGAVEAAPIASMPSIEPQDVPSSTHIPNPDLDHKADSSFVPAHSDEVESDAEEPKEMKVSKADVFAALKKVSDTKGMTAARGVLQAFGYTRIGELKPVDFEKFVAACEKSITAKK